MTKPRYSSQPLPSYVFVPGENPHPKKAGGHMEGLGDPVAAEIDPLHPQLNPDFTFAIDLFNHGYFWESHVYFEALWNAHKRKGPVADLMKAFIKLGAAGVKLSIGQKTSALGHFERAKELLAGVEAREGSPFLGFDLTHIQKNILESSQGDLQIFDIHPGW